MNNKKIGATLLLIVTMLVVHGQEPYFRLRDLNNQWQEYGDLKGSKITVIDFWATWCQPCVQSIPVLNSMAKEFADQGVRFIGVSIDGPRNQSKIAPFVQSMGVIYPVLRDLNSELMSELNVTAVPTLLIYDADGDQLFVHEGFRPGDEVTIHQHIMQNLGK